MRTTVKMGIVFGQRYKAAGDKSGIFVTVTPMCLWMRLCPEWLSTSQDDQVFWMASNAGPGWVFDLDLLREFFFRKVTTDVNPSFGHQRR